MDYELKCIIAFCIIVKLVALSSEFSIRPETERLNQSSDTVKPEQLTSLAEVKELPATSAEGMNQGMYFNLGPGEKKSNSDYRIFNKKYITKSEQVRINSAFDTCEHMAELLESSKWRDIQKTLHWLNRILASSEKTVGRCRRKSEKMKAKFGVINKKVSENPVKTNSKAKIYFEMKKSPDAIMKCGQNLINSLKPHISGQSEKLKRECKRKYKSKHSHRKKPRRRTKKRKKIQHHVNEGPKGPNHTSGILSDSEKDYSLGGSGKDLENKEKGSLAKWPVTLELRKSDGKNYKKENPWPNFVYHRVSSDLFHLGATDSNHKQSAYVAISVNTSGEIDAVKNKNRMFGL